MEQGTKPWKYKDSWGIEWSEAEKISILDSTFYNAVFHGRYNANKPNEFFAIELVYDTISPNWYLEIHGRFAPDAIQKISERSLAIIKETEEV